MNTFFIMKIFLIGFMGAGKTFIGKKLAAELNLPFYDLDKELEKKAAITIEQIFIQLEEPFFREIESGLLLNWNKDGIAATGGGIVEKAENRYFLKNNKIISIWLNPIWKTIEKRIILSARPLVKKLSTSEIKKLWQNRLPLYKECSDLVISKENEREIISEITEFIKNRNTNKH